VRALEKLLAGFARIGLPAGRARPVEMLIGARVVATKQEAMTT
jgi:hypothetical protein